MRNEQPKKRLGHLVVPAFLNIKTRYSELFHLLMGLKNSVSFAPYYTDASTVKNSERCCSRLSSIICSGLIPCSRSTLIFCTRNSSLPTT